MTTHFSLCTTDASLYWLEPYRSAAIDAVFVSGNACPWCIEPTPHMHPLTGVVGDVAPAAARAGETQ